jgi:hypothetical protein
MHKMKKMKKAPFTTSADGNLTPISILNADVGIVGVQYNGKHRYFIVVADETTRYMWGAHLETPLN